MDLHSSALFIHKSAITLLNVISIKYKLSKGKYGEDKPPFLVTSIIQKHKCEYHECIEKPKRCKVTICSFIKFNYSFLNDAMIRQFKPMQ
jgi:hypothetical protein